MVAVMIVLAGVICKESKHDIRSRSWVAGGDLSWIATPRLEV